MNAGLRLFPEEASTQAPATDTLFLILMIVSAAIIILVVALVVTFSLRYRRGTDANRGPLRDLVSREFEIGWTAGTCFLALFLFWWSGQRRSFDACCRLETRWKFMSSASSGCGRRNIRMARGRSTPCMCR